MRGVVAAVGLALLAPSAALAVPLQLAHQGRLVDAEQVPLAGEHDLTFRLYDAATDGALLWDDTVTATVTGGYYAAVLGADPANPLDDGIFATSPVYLELAVDDGEPLTPRQEIASVPFALRAATAENVEGGYVDASDISVDGQLVIDGGGAWVGPTPSVAWEDLEGVPGGLDSLGGLSCADGDIAAFDGDAGLWTCGSDRVLSDGEVLAVVDGAVLDLGIGSSVDGGIIATLDDLDAHVVDLAQLDTTGAALGQSITFDGASAAWTDSVAGCELVVVNEIAETALFACGGDEVALRPRPRFSVIDAHYLHACGVRSDGTAAGRLACWGDNSYGKNSPPGGTYVDACAGENHSCAVAEDGSLACWGYNGAGETDAPTVGTFTEVDCGYRHACALRSDGVVECWGQNNQGEASPPGGTFTSVVTGGNHSCALDSTGAAVCWGSNSAGQSTSPGGTFTQIDVGGHSTCGLRASGAVECWGTITNLYSTPGGSFTHVDLSVNHACGVEVGGGITCWGPDDFGELDALAGTWSAALAGQYFSCGITDVADTVACWGDGTYGQQGFP